MTVFHLSCHPVKGAPLNNFTPHIPTKGIVDLGDSDAINLEKLLALKPDLIMGIKLSAAQIYPQLSQIAPTVVVEFNHSGEWKEDFAFVGKVLGKSEQVKQVMADYSQRVEDFLQKMNTDGKSNTQVSVVRLYPETITLYTKVGFIGTILEDAGLSRPPSQDLDLEATERISGSPIQYNISREADWNRPYEFLDKEFQKIAKDSEQGRRYADKLVKVWHIDGREMWLLIHIEIQAIPEDIFPQGKRI